MINTNDINNQLITAMDIISDSKISNLKLDKTVKAVIIELIDASRGEYKVSYSGNVLNAFASNLDEIYEKGQQVYLKIPENDFNNKKIIEGIATENYYSDSQTTDLSNIIEKVGPEWKKIYTTLPREEDKYYLSSGADIFYKVIWNRDEQSPESLALSDQIFLSYSKNYDKIQVEADFQTSFVDYSITGQGNYGLILTFDAKKQSEDKENGLSDDYEISYKFDTNAFTGNPYSFAMATPQKTVLDIKSDYLVRLKRITFFKEGFNEHPYTDDISVSNIKIQFAEKLDLTQQLYYLSLKTPLGTTVRRDNEELIVVAELLYKGKNVLNSKTGKCQWFIQDSSVHLGSDNYIKEAGPGWRAIDNDTEILKVSGSDIKFFNKYMVLISYGKDVKISKAIELYNDNSIYNFSLEQSMDGKDSILKLKNNSQLSSTNIITDWYYSYNDGTYANISKNDYKDTLVINEYLIYSSAKFYCQIKQKVGENQYSNICILEKEISNATLQSDLAIEYQGKDVFNYNVDGDMPIENCEKDQTLYPKLSWKDGCATTYIIEWRIKDQIIKENQKMNPPNSMMEQMWLDNDGVLHFKIKQKYNNLCNNNTITLKIITVDNKEFIFDKEIIFIKTGDQGTNGTTYISAVRAVDDYLDKISGFTYLPHDGSLKLRNFIYKDGELINNQTDKYEIVYEWESDGNRSERIEKESDEKGKVVNITGYKEDITPTFDIIKGQSSDVISIRRGSGVNFNRKDFYSRMIIKATATIIDKTDKESKRVVLHYNYPVPVVTGGNPQNKEINISIPQYIKYNQNGLSAAWDTTYLNFTVDGEDYTSKLVAKDTNLLSIVQVTDDDKKTHYKFVPASKYDYDNNGNTIIEIKEPFSMVYPVMMFLDTYGNEAINNWDGTNIAIYDGEGKNKGYILAPQIGAGSKDEEGKFTGLVMGKDTTQKIEGLYGYSKGVNTLGIKSDGTMYLGKSVDTGRIDFNGNSGIIKGGGGGENATGMTIRLTNKVNDRGEAIKSQEERNKVKAIQIAKDKFTIDYDGRLKTVMGEIGGWIIKDTGIYSPDTIFDDKDTVKSEGSIMLISKSEKDKKGLAYIQNANIGGWTINEYGIYSPETVLNDKGEVTTEGHVMLNSKNNTATINEGYIGLWKIHDNLISSDVQKTLPDKTRADTILDAKTGTITTEFFEVVQPKAGTGKGSPVGKMGVILGAGIGSGGQTVPTYNIGLMTESSEHSIILDAGYSEKGKGANIALRANKNIYFNAVTGDIIGGAINKIDLAAEKDAINLSAPKLRLNGSKESHIYLTGDGGITLTAGKSSIQLLSNGELRVSTAAGAEGQHGIYCRFA